ncbi:MAG: undecaprenyl-diphosphate phosphatase [Actinomycetaceae bacterium]|nr:undecaprenyl-diphosphate phosphatase [Actinomycetaceae bacterium]
MTYIEAVVLGVLQGLTEFLPISSSAHLRVAGELMSSDPGAAFTAITQLGTETAVLLYFWKDIVRILTHWFMALPVWPTSSRISPADPDARLGWWIILGSLPIGILGFLLEDLIDTSLRNLWITASTLIVFAVFLGLADKFSKQVKTLENMTWKEALTYGLFQAMALVPGVSRSGGTITAGLLMGYTRSAAARYSFLLALPAVFASGLFKLYRALTDPQEVVYAGPTIVATVLAFVIGYLVIMWFLKLISTRSFMPFVGYRVVFSVVIVALLVSGVLTPVSTHAGAM